jgi:hypothetical protein
MSKTVREVLLVAIFLVQVGLLSNCGSSSSTEMSLAVVSVSISSQSTSAVVGQTVQFTATVSGTSNTAVTWSVNAVVGGDSSVGTISSTGMYTAPGVPPSPNAVTVQVTSVADTSKTASLKLPISNPNPQLTSISPAAIGIGGGNLAQVAATSTVVTVNGTGFAPQSTVIANGTPLATTFVSATQLTATVPASLVASPGVLQLTVSTPAPGGGTTSSFSFTVLAVGQVSATNNPQVAQYSITLPRDANVSIQFGLDTNYGLETWSQPTASGGGTVNMLVAGMRGFTTYHMQAVVSFPDGTQYLDSDQTFTTGGLPAERVPQLTVTEPTPGLSPNPGIELLDLVFGTTNQVEAAAVDLQGNLIWYYDFDSTGGALPDPIKPLPNGHMKIAIGFVYPNPSLSVVREIDLAGNTISELTTPQLNDALVAAGSNIVALGFHHDFALLPNGHTVYIVFQQEDFTDLPGLPGTTTVTGDALVDVDPNGNVTWTWSTFDHFDINYHPLGLADWTHSNAVIYSSSDGNLLLSCRSLSWITKIDYRNGQGTGDVLWRLGPNGDFNLVDSLIVPNPGPGDWFYNQHFPVFLSPVTAGFFKLGVWDNGNTRPDPNTGLPCGTEGAAPCYSRGVVLQMNEGTKTARITFDDKLPLFALCCGNIGILGNSDFEFGAGAESVSPDSGQVLEVTPTGSQTVWQLAIENQFAYRAFRIPSLYPGVQW